MPDVPVRLSIPGLRMHARQLLPGVRGELRRVARMTRDRAVFCGSCGLPARLAVASIDPRYPLVLCAWTTGDGANRGCGRVPGTYDHLEASRWVRQGKITRATQRHGRHDTRGGRSPMCSKCHPELEPAGAVG